MKMSLRLLVKPHRSRIVSHLEGRIWWRRPKIELAMLSLPSYASKTLNSQPLCNHHEETAIVTKLHPGTHSFLTFTFA